MMKYRKKPVVVEAMLFVGGHESVLQVVEWVRSYGGDARYDDLYRYVSLPTLEGTMMARPGDWVIRGVQGEFYPCKPDIFDATYEPEPETDVVLPRQPLRNPRTYTATADPAPSPSPEVGEGWRHPVSWDEAAVACSAGVLREVGGDAVDGESDLRVLERWAADAHDPSELADYEVPSGWAEGRELVTVDEAMGRTIGSGPIRRVYPPNPTGSVSVFRSGFVGAEGAGVFIANADGKVWVDPLPKQETGPVEPHESEDPEELAAAVAAGLRVNPRPPGADWEHRQTYDGTVGAFREALDYGFRFRIHGTVPGYGETGGAS